MNNRERLREWERLLWIEWFMLNMPKPSFLDYRANRATAKRGLAA